MKQNFFLEKFKDRELVILILAALFIIIMAPVFLIPKIKKISELKKEITKENREIEALTQKVLDLQTLSEAELYESADLMLTALPAEKNFYFVLNSLKKICQDYQIGLTSFEMFPGEISTESASLKKTSDGGLSPLTVKISFFAAFADLRKFLEGLEKSLPLMELTSLKFSSLTDDAAGGIQSLEGEMVINTYVSPLPKFLGKVDRPVPKINLTDQKLIDELKSFSRYRPQAIVEEPVIVGKEDPFSL